MEFPFSLSFFYPFIIPYGGEISEENLRGGDKGDKIEDGQKNV
jgi:hypothetical protein